MKSGDRRPFRNREQAGRVLAQRLKSYANRTDVIVLALPRGGLPVAVEVAAALRAPLMCSSCASSARRDNRNWRWGRSRAAACVCSTMMSCTR